MRHQGRGIPTWMFRLELEYVNNPVLLLVGSTKLNKASPNIFDEIVKVLNVGLALFTIKEAVIVPEL